MRPLVHPIAQPPPLLLLTLAGKSGVRPQRRGRVGSDRSRCNLRRGLRRPRVQRGVCSALDLAASTGRPRVEPELRRCAALSSGVPAVLSSARRPLKCPPGSPLQWPLSGRRPNRAQGEETVDVRRVDAAGHECPRSRVGAVRSRRLVILLVDRLEVAHRGPQVGEVAASERHETRNETHSTQKRRFLVSFSFFLTFSMTFRVFDGTFQGAQ